MQIFLNRANKNTQLIIKNLHFTRFFSSMESSKKEYDLIVVGAGSGGVASARRVGAMGKKVCILEHGYVGGTCVNVGCVPKKLMWYGSSMYENFGNHAGYGIHSGKPSFDWNTIYNNRENYLRKLNGIYEENLKKSNVELVKGDAKFISNKEISCDGSIYTGENILIASGSKPFVVSDLEGGEHTITSDGFFALKEQPKSVLVVGAGYIGVELSGMLSGFGTDTTLVIRESHLLRPFDRECTDTLLYNLKESGLKVRTNAVIKKVEKRPDGTLRAHFEDGDPLDAETIIMAVGRVPNTDRLGLENTDIKTGKKGEVIADEQERTSVPGVYAVGDCASKLDLTPVAIKAGRLLIDRIYNNGTDIMDYKGIPSVVFGHPPLGSVGLNEEEAIKEYGKDNIEVFMSNFVNMFFALTEHKEKSLFKLICVKPDMKVIGLHGVGRGMDEIVQGFAVAIRMGATKSDFDKTTAIHPTAGEEFVLMKI